MTFFFGGGDAHLVLWAFLVNLFRGSVIRYVHIYKHVSSYPSTSADVLPSLP